MKIAIIGISGSGKSTLSRKIAKLTNLSLFHMDELFWRGNWEAVPEKMYLQKHREIIERDDWIIEGYVDSAMSERLQRADQIIYFDYSGFLCAWRLVKRWLKHRKESRPELPKEALEKLQGSFLWTVFRRKERLQIEKALKGIDDSRVVRVKSPIGLKGVINQWGKTWQS
jgi:adenylate kinase family enzyme